MVRGFEDFCLAGKKTKRFKYEAKKSAKEFVVRDELPTKPAV